MTTLTTYPLRLPKSVKEAAERLSKADGTSLNQFVAIAVAEKIAALKTAEFFAERRRRATPDALDALLSRTDGEPRARATSCPRAMCPVGPRDPAPRKPAKPKPAATKPASTPRRAAKAKT